MRTLEPAPASALDPATRQPRWGSYRGALPRVDLTGFGPRGPARLAREKRWLYGAVATDALFLGFCVVDLGYTLAAFAYAFDRARHALVVDRSWLAPPGFGGVRQTAELQYHARLDHPAGVLRVERWRGRDEMTVDLRVPGLEVHAALACDVPTPSVTAIVPIRDAGGAVNVTEKRALLPVRGAAMVRGARHDLAEGVGGYDYTHGLLARRTAWRWSFALGTLEDGAPFAVNVVRGFVGEAECVAWVGDEVHPLGEAAIDFDAAHPLAPWRVRAPGGLDLTLRPGGAHAEARALGVVASRFVQPVGAYEGALALPGRAGTVARAVGVAEDQSVLW